MMAWRRKRRMRKQRGGWRTGGCEGGAYYRIFPKDDVGEEAGISEMK